LVVVAIALCCGVTGYLRLYGLEYEDAFEYVASARLWAERPNAANVLNTYCVALGAAREQRNVSGDSRGYFLRIEALFCSP